MRKITRLFNMARSFINQRLTPVKAFIAMYHVPISEAIMAIAYIYGCTYLLLYPHVSSVIGQAVMTLSFIVLFLTSFKLNRYSRELARKAGYDEAAAKADADAQNLLESVQRMNIGSHAGDDGYGNNDKLRP